jgi:hypothetical protein
VICSCFCSGAIEHDESHSRLSKRSTVRNEDAERQVLRAGWGLMDFSGKVLPCPCNPAAEA